MSHVCPRRPGSSLTAGLFGRAPFPGLSDERPLFILCHVIHEPIVAVHVYLPSLPIIPFRSKSSSPFTLVPTLAGKRDTSVTQPGAHGTMISTTRVKQAGLSS